MNKPRLNFVIDAVMFLIMMALAGIGLLMKFVLIPGRERWAKYGRQVELYLFGWDRHDWGAIHFYLALTLLGVLILHIILHWSQIVGLFHRLITTPKTRTVVFWIFLLTALILIYFPFLVSPEVQDIGRGRGRGWQRSSVETHMPCAIAPSSAAPSAEGPACGSCPEAAAPRLGNP